MSRKLLKWMFFDDRKVIGWMFGSLLITLACFWICTWFSNPVMEGLKFFFLVIGVLLTGLILFGCLYLFWKQTVHAFFDRQAYRIRMLPLSRLQILKTLMVYGVILALAAVAATCLTIIAIGRAIWMTVLEDFSMLEVVFEGKFYAFVCLGIIGTFLSMVFYELVIGMGIYYGYRRPSSHMGWSLVFAFLFSYLFQLIMVLAFGLYILAAGFVPFAERISFSPMSAVIQIGWMEVGILFVTNLVLFGIENKLYAKPCDVES